MRPLFFVTAVVVLSMISSVGYSQDDNDYSNNRGRKNKQYDRAVNSNKKTPVKIIEYIVGTWQVNNVYKGEKDVSDTDTLAQQQQTMEFTREGKYIAYSGTEKIDSGLYRLNEQQSKLYLESQGHGNPVEWNVTFRKNEMTLQNAASSAKAEKLKYVYSRKSVKPLHKQ